MIFAQKTDILFTLPKEVESYGRIAIWRLTVHDKSNKKRDPRMWLGQDVCLAAHDMGLIHGAMKEKKIGSQSIDIRCCLIMINLSGIYVQMNLPKL